MRTVILHYHLFKNAGTSLDAILRRNFGERWLTREFSDAANSQAVAEWIAATPEGIAYSSHTAQGPLPRIPGVEVISVLFLRDPVARIRSAHAFEQRQAAAGGAATLGTRLAGEHGLEGYVRARLALPGDRQCRNFHVARLARFVPGPARAELDRAIRALALLTLVGRVEEFDASLARLSALLRPHWPDFATPPLHLNRSAAPEEEPLPESLAALLEEANALDRRLIAQAAATIWAPADPADRT